MAGFKGGAGAAGEQMAAVAATSLPSILPNAGSLVQSAAFGAAFSGVTTAVTDTMRVRDGEMTRQEAVRDVAKSSLQGATTMAIAATAAHVARAHPVLGVAVLAVAGLGLLGTLRNKRKAAAPTAG